MTLHTDMRTILSDHLTATGLSQSALSRRAGVGGGTVSKILREPSYVPSAPVIHALSAAIGAALPDPFMTGTRTWAQVREDLRAVDPGDPRISRINWLMRAANWVAEAEPANHRRVVKFFKSNVPATFDLAPSSYASYKSQLLSCLPKSAVRIRGIRDVVGPLRVLYDALGQDEAFRNYHLSSGAFFAWMDSQQLSPQDLVPETLDIYYRDRLAARNKTEKATRVHLQRIAALTRCLAAHSEYASYNFPALPSPWERPDVLPGDPEIAPLLAEFDSKVAPWLRGQLSATGETREAFLKRLDAVASANRPSDARAAALARVRARSASPAEADNRVEEVMAGAGFLRTRERWCDATISSYRKTLRALARRLFVKEGVLIASIIELVDADNLEMMFLLTLEDNPDLAGLGSAYAGTFAGRTLKLAMGYVGVSKDNLLHLKALRSRFTVCRAGIAPRNQAKIENFTEERTRRFCDLSAHLLREVKLEVAARRRRAHEQRRPAGLADLYDCGLACRVMQVIAHDLMIARAPRSANVIKARLEWIRWRDGCASLVVPASEVKMRRAGDADLVVPLGVEASGTLKDYLDMIRAKALREGDDANPYLFPSPRVAGQPYNGLLNKLCKRVHEHVGASLTPHLYRHLMGWVWLRRDPAALPQVQRLLGHRNISTTMRYYAVIADDVAINLWQTFITREKAR